MTANDTSSASGFILQGAGNGAFNGSITGSPNLALTKSGAGTWSLGAANTHTGSTTLSGGTLALGHVNALQNSTLDTGTTGAQTVAFAVAGTNTYNLGGLTGSDDIDLGANTLSVGANNASTTFGGGLSGTGSLTKAGTGTLTLSGSNSYSGATLVNAGALRISHANGLGSTLGATTVATGAAVELSGNITVTGET